ncbi:MAG: uncharacterized protein KVP18_003490 [Porospora cf. gigantea A]|uniref:uncharacterized protein n=1 Tax=Porospora cf. gigantea A TaxID=2853593 RepID=UPI0035596B00|nr:MAG: hypothetical protein KVP18_003490 [Porospora cf. gigantea A]
MSIVAGDLAILFGGHEQIYSTTLEKGGVLCCHYGNFKHDDMIGHPWGSKVLDHKKKKWFAVLRPTPELITLSLKHRTQILYLADISVVTMFLDAKPGAKIVESGTGSGSMTVSLARAVGATGKVFTFEFHAGRYHECTEEFKLYGLEETIQTNNRDVCLDGFLVDGLGSGTADGVFLDLPQPWLALPHADEVLSVGGRLVNFSPCIEQVSRVCQWLGSHDYSDVTTVECLIKGWNGWIHSGDSNQRGPKEVTVPPKVDIDVPHCATVNVPRLDRVPLENFFQHQLPMKTHTGYLTLAVKPSNDP